MGAGHGICPTQVRLAVRTVSAESTRSPTERRGTYMPSPMDTERRYMELRRMRGQTWQSDVIQIAAQIAGMHRHTNSSPEDIAARAADIVDAVHTEKRRRNGKDEQVNRVVASDGSCTGSTVTV